MMMRQTRASTMAARAAAASVTPSPTKKQKVHNASVPSPQAQVERRTLFPVKDSTITREEIRQLIRSHIPNAADNISTKTMDGWCLVDALLHCATASNGMLKDLILKNGPPKCYLKYFETGKTSTRGRCDDGYQSFRSLCRIVAGQQLAGSTASAIWERFLAVVGASKNDATSLTPQAILSIVRNGNVEDDLRAPAGISNAKCRCIIALSEAFEGGELSDDILKSASDEEVSQKLQNVKGIGPWSVDMFLLFESHRKNVLPIGDLAVRNGTAKLWKVKGKGKNGKMCAKKDKHLIESLHEPFSPYRSISSYYMYQLVDVKG
mmetsp:Transcript_4686/g.7634  ORF Transcript_4686/g.7634 Transcript_4686/m.7634 type:complete len:321 (-) Transcript_4686:871-1833(-)